MSEQQTYETTGWADWIVFTLVMTRIQALTAHGREMKVGSSHVR